MWIPPWTHRPYALGAYGPRQVLAKASDMEVIRVTRDHVLRQIAAGRPFYENVPQVFVDRFKINAHGIWNSIYHSKNLMIQGYDTEERKDQATRIVNKTFYNALRALATDGATFRGQSSLASWLYTIARHAMIDDLRMYMRSPEGLRRDEEYRNRKHKESDAEGRVDAADEAIEAGAAVVAIADVLELRDERGNMLVSEPDVKIIRAAERAGGDFAKMGRVLGISKEAAENEFIEAARRAEAARKKFYSGRASTTVSSKERVRMEREARKKELEELLKS